MRTVGNVLLALSRVGRVFVYAMKATPITYSWVVATLLDLDLARMLWRRG